MAGPSKVVESAPLDAGIWGREAEVISTRRYAWTGSRSRTGTTPSSWSGPGSSPTGASTTSRLVALHIPGQYDCNIPSNRLGQGISGGSL